MVLPIEDEYLKRLIESAFEVLPRTEPRLKVYNLFSLVKYVSNGNEVSGRLNKEINGLKLELSIDIKNMIDIFDKIFKLDDLSHDEALRFYNEYKTMMLFSKFEGLNLLEFFEKHKIAGSVLFLHRPLLVKFINKTDDAYLNRFIATISEIRPDIVVYYDNKDDVKYTKADKEFYIDGPLSTMRENFEYKYTSGYNIDSKKFDKFDKELLSTMSVLYFLDPNLNKYMINKNFKRFMIDEVILSRGSANTGPVEFKRVVELSSGQQIYDDIGVNTFLKKYINITSFLLLLGDIQPLNNTNIGLLKYNREAVKMGLSVFLLMKVMFGIKSNLLTVNSYIKVLKNQKIPNLVMKMEYFYEDNILTRKTRFYMQAGGYTGNTFCTI